MRKIKISQLSILLALTLSMHASPLLFKTTKEIKTDTSEEITVFDASKYKNLRIGIHILGSDPMNCVNVRSKSMLLRDLEMLRSSALRAEEQVKPGVPSTGFPRNSPERIRTELAEKEEAYKKAKEFPCANTSIMVVEADDEFRLDQMPPVSMSNGIAFYSIMTPPQKLKIVGHGAALYKIYIWGD
jgi:hypothetical protein